MVLSTRQMSVSCAEVEYILSPPKARSPCLQRACKVRDTHVHWRASMRRLHPLRHTYVDGTGHAHWRHSCRRLSRSRLALNLHLPVAQNVPAMHVGGAPLFAARTCLLGSRRRHSSYCTLFNNHCVLSTCSCVSQNTHRRCASAVRFSAFRLPNPMQTWCREVHSGLWPRH